MLDINGSAVIAEAIVRVQDVGSEKNPRATVHIITGGAIVFEGMDAAMLVSTMEDKLRFVRIMSKPATYVNCEAVAAVQPLPNGVRLFVPGMPQGCFWQGVDVKGAMAELAGEKKPPAGDADAPKLPAQPAVQ